MPIKPILILLLSTLFCVLGQNAFSQKITNTVTGTVSDAVSGTTLPGATVLIENTSQGTVTDLNGNFKISGITGTKAVLKISFLGYKTISQDCDFSKKNVLALKIKLTEELTNLQGVDIIGKSEGQTQAMIRQREATNIKNIISAEQIKQFPDVNAADVVQRIPGITVQRDQGEGRYVQLRGTAPEFTNFNINGEQISSPESGARYVGLDVIAADQIEMIEVTKVLTPDMDADGIAGNVNIITKSAKDTIPDISASVSGGYNSLMKTNNYQLQFSYGQRYKKLGFQLNTSYYNNDQGSHNMEYDYTRGPVLGQANDTSGADNFYVLYKDIELRHYTITRKRTGLSANFDYKLKPGTTFYLRGMYNLYSDDEQRRRMSYNLTDANDPLTYREAGISHDLKDRVKIQNIATLNLGAEQKFGNGIKLDYELAWSKASEKQPNRMETGFDNGGITMVINNADPQWPTVAFPYESDSIDAFTYKNYDFNDLLFVNSSINDVNYTAKLNLEIPYQLNSGQHGSVKFGGKIRTKEKRRNSSAQAFNKYFQKVSIYSQVGPPLNLTTVEDDFSENNLLNHNYIINHIPGPGEMRDFYEKHPQNFKFDEIETWSKTYSEDYLAKEDVYAAYLMFRHEINKLMVLGGLRYEITNIDNQGVKAGVDYAAGGVLYLDTIYDKRSHHFILPQLQFKYSLDEKTNIRASATYTYSRPNFDDIIPYREEQDDDVKIGNPDLKYPVSLNIDFLAEKYLPNSGVLSGGFFYKQIDNIVFKYSRNAHEGTDFNRYGLKKITMAVNGLNASVFGAEIQTQFKFTWLPGIWSDFGIYGNYTFTQSDAFISKRYPQNENDVIFIFNEDEADFFTTSGETESIPLPGQAQHAGNLALYYDAPKLYVKLSANYHSAFLDELGNDSGLDIYNDQSLHLDFNANYQLNNNLNFFVDVINLTNAPLRYYMGTTDYFKKQEYYSWWGKVGIKLNL
jgi:TonB-dependent receptor